MTPPGPFGVPVDVERAPVTVLHVDDDSSVCRLVKNFLEQSNGWLTVETATSAGAALELLDVNCVECIVSDFDMPESNGLQLLQQVRERDPDIPFILFTGKGSEEIASEAIAAGVTDYLRKGTGTERFDILAKRIENGVRRYRAQRALAAGDERYRKLAESAPLVILTTDDADTVTNANSTVECVFGQSSSALVGSSVFSLFPPEHHDAIRAALDVERDSERRVAEPISVEVPSSASTNVVLALEVTLSAVELDGANEMTWIIRDVSEEVRRERDFRAVFECAFDAMVFVNDDGEFVDANPVACELFGLERTALLGRSVAEFAPTDNDHAPTDDDHAPTDDEDATMLAQVQSSDRERGTITLVRPDGDQRTVEFAATRLVRPDRHLLVLRDGGDPDRPGIRGRHDGQRGTSVEETEETDCDSATSGE